MKKILLILVALSVVSFGCAAKQPVLDPNYQAYKEAVMTQKPLVSIEWNEDMTKIKKLEVNPQINIQQKQPDAPHPGWSVANSLIRATGIVGAIWAGGQAIEGIVEAGRGTTLVDGSYNQPGGNMAGGNVEIPTTTTTTENITTSTY